MAWRFFCSLNPFISREHLLPRCARYSDFAERLNPFISREHLLRLKLTVSLGTMCLNPFISREHLLPNWGSKVLKTDMS